MFYANFRGGSRAAATSKIECFVIIVNGFQPLSIITKRSILDVAVALYPSLNLHFLGKNTFVLMTLGLLTKRLVKQWCIELNSRINFLQKNLHQLDQLSKQRNILHKPKSSYFENLDIKILGNKRTSWNSIKPLFSNKLRSHAQKL